MRHRKAIALVTAGLVLNLASVLFAQDEDYQKDSAEGLPGDYANQYLIAKSTMSPDEKFAVIYPTTDFSESKEAKDLFVALKPFKVLATLPTAELYYERKSYGAPGADWSEDGRVALITFDGKWGPTDVFLIEVADGELKRTTNLVEKMRELLRPSFRATKPKPPAYNDAYEFVFLEEEGGPCQFAEDGQVRIYVRATNDPKGGEKRRWKVLLDAKWNIAQAKFTSHKITNARAAD
ncbi:MAG TPA: hypothetical protein VF551_08920 [Chthoniobacterales bacterium]|jgi:hypothetical protein